MQTIQDSFGLLRIFGLLRQSVIKQDVTRLRFDILNAVLGDVRHLDQVGIRCFCKCFYLLFLVCMQLVILLNVNFREHNHKRFSLEQRLNRVEELNLLLDCVTTRLRNI